MSATGNFTFYSSDSGGGAQSLDFIRDAFDDISLPATNNTGFSDTVGKNPFSKFFANTDAPQYGAKTLWIKDLVLESDRTKWVSDKPTYRVIFTESCPSIYAYVAGNVRLRNRENGISVDLRGVGDLLGISGVVRRVQFLVNAVNGTSTASVQVDGTANATTIQMGSAPNPTAGVNLFNAQVHAASNEDKEIHDYRIVGANAYGMSISGIIVYFENSGQNIDCFPGTTYVNKDKKTTTSINTLSIPSFSLSNGAISQIYKTSSAGYTAVTVQAPSLETVATGSSGTNTVAVSTGTGSSFPAGTGFVTQFGSTTFVGMVRSVSTDTLTVGPTLTYGISGLLYSTWKVGPTYAINASLYQLAYTFDPSQANTVIDPNGFVKGATSGFYFSDNEKRYHAWGRNLDYVQTDGFNGIGFKGVSSCIQLDGRFQAAEIEMAATPGATPAIWHATFGINGIEGSWSVNEGYTGAVRRTVFTDSGPGWNSFVMGTGSSHGNMAITKINFYQMRPSIGVSYGHLAKFDHNTDIVSRSAINATLMALGTHQRVYADEIYLTGHWERGLTSTAAGGVYYQGASTNSIATVGFYGKDWAALGVASASFSISLDGAGVGSTLNTFISGATEGFHNAIITNRSGSIIIQAFDYTRVRGELINQQTVSPIEIPDTAQVYEQGSTPVNPKKGDVWAPNAVTGELWVYLFSRWNKVDLTDFSDDPQVSAVTTYGGDA